VYNNVFMPLDKATLTMLGNRGIPQISRFSADGAIPTPDPDLLAFHAQICQILNLSGLWTSLVKSKPKIEHVKDPIVAEYEFISGTGDNV
jgi:hypothetical protein